MVECKYRGEDIMDQTVQSVWLTAKEVNRDVNTSKEENHMALTYVLERQKKRNLCLV